MVGLAVEQPAWGQVRVADAVKERGMSISPFSVRCVWQRYGLANMKKRLKALEGKMAETGVILTGSRIATLKGLGRHNRCEGQRGLPWQTSSCLPQ